MFARTVVDPAIAIVPLDAFGIVAFAGMICAVAFLTIPSPRRVRGRELALLAGGLIAGIVILALWGFSLGHSGVGVGAVIEHLSSISEASLPGSVENRSQLWHIAFILWRAHPIFGIGAGNANAGLRAFLSCKRTRIVAIATLAFVAISIFAFVRAPFREPFVIGALGASIGLATHQLLDLLVFHPKVGELWWIVLALGAARKDAPEPAPSRV